LLYFLSLVIIVIIFFWWFYLVILEGVKAKKESIPEATGGPGQEAVPEV
jgi:hypothetical protein